jgi:GT2 family glycosyltransferase
MSPTRIFIYYSTTLPETSVDDVLCVRPQERSDSPRYHYRITADGQVITGCAEQAPEAYEHSTYRECVEICCIGNFNQTKMPERQWNTLVSLVCDLAAQYSISPDRISSHDGVVSMSTQDGKTSLAGEHLYTRLETLRSRVAHCCAPDLRGSRIVFEPTHDELVLVHGFLKGRQFERAWERCPKGINWVRLTLTEPGSRFEAWCGRAPLSIGGADGLEGTFELTLPQGLLKATRYECVVLPAEDAEPEENGEYLPYMHFYIDLPLHGVRKFSVPPMRAEVSAERIQGAGPFLVRLKGKVVNTGSLPWINSDDRAVFTVGAVVFAADGKSDPCMELRHDFSTARVEVGQELPFSFTIDIGELPVGEYYVHVDVLREHCYWFTHLGSIGGSIPIKVNERRKEDTKESERALHPPNSWAAVPQDASVLYIAPTMPQFDSSTGGRRLLDLLRILRKDGVKVTFLYEQVGWGGDLAKYARKLDELGVEQFPDPRGFLADIKDPSSFNLVVLGWHATANAVIATVRERLPHVRIAVDSVDIQWAREAQAGELGLMRKTPEMRDAEKAKERRAYARADEVWVVSEDEAEILARELPAAKWRVVGIPCRAHESYVEELTGEKALFVGGFAHPPNESAALWAAEIVGEFNARRSQSVHLDIVGAQPPVSVRELERDSHVSVHGFVPSLNECHQQARVFLAPLTYGGGVKGKISDAICRGIPVITNAIGNAGLGLQHGTEILLGETTEDFVKLLDDVYAGRYDLEAIRKKALEKLLSFSGEEVVRDQMLSSIVAPHVVIGIVTFNQRELLRQCLHSVLQKTSYQNYTIAVVSNGCSDGTQQMLREYAAAYPNRIEVFLSDTNNFFVRPCNQIINKYPESDIVLMNNDVEVINVGWLTNLVDAAYSARHVCGSGGLVFDSDGVVSEAGAEIYSSGLGKNLYRGSSGVGGAALAIRYVGFVSGCLMYMRRDAIRAIGALDEEYHPMYFEDVAWHYTAHSRGLKTLYTPWSRIVHKEGSSAGKDLTSGMKRYQEINRKKFLKKFQGIDFERFNYGR